MQSLNEELQTVNMELEQRNRALSQTNDDMQNLLNSTEIATVFLDDKLAIKRFTTQAKRVFSLIDTDIGRPIADLVANLRDDRLLLDAREVLRTLVFHEREIQTKEGAWRLMRIMPYRTHENLIDGLVLTFIDIDRVKLTEQREQIARAHAEAVLDAVPMPLLVLDPSLRVTAANRAFYERFAATPKLVIDAPYQAILERPAEANDLQHKLETVLNDGRRVEGFRLSGRFVQLGHAAFSVIAQRVPGPGARHSLLLMLDEST